MYVNSQMDLHNQVRKSVTSELSKVLCKSTTVPTILSDHKLTIN